jgi:hypothetical protein
VILMKRLLLTPLLALLLALASGCGDKIENAIVTPTAVGTRQVAPPVAGKPPATISGSVPKQ